MKDTLGKVIALVILIILGISQVVQLNTANQDRQELRAEVQVLQAQVESLGGEPVAGPERPEGTIIVGEPGPEGPEGDEGPQGPPGEDGEDGTPGPAGPQGEPGSAGQTGLTGPEGPAGTDGVDGTDGPQGSTGPGGPPGPIGPEGPQGPAGETGPTGYPKTWTFTYTDILGIEHTYTCTDPDQDGNGECQEM